MVVVDPVGEMLDPPWQPAWLAVRCYIVQHPPPIKQLLVNTSSTSMAQSRFHKTDNDFHSLLTGVSRDLVVNLKCCGFGDGPQGHIFEEQKRWQPPENGENENNDFSVRLILLTPTNLIFGNDNIEC